MSTYTLISFLLLLHSFEALDDGSSASIPDLSRTECESQGIVIGDIGNGAIFREDYICDSNRQPPIAYIVPQAGEPISAEGAVCCGNGVFTTSNRPDLSRSECEDEGIVVGDIGNGAIFQDDYICDSNGQPPIAYIVPQEGEPISFEGEVCCGMENSATTTQPDFSRAECEAQGIVIGDIGNGAIFQDDYICESNGQPPIGYIVPQEGENISFEGEVCCGNDGISTTINRSNFSRAECEDQGIVVGDIGNGAIFQEDYICESNNQPPIGYIVPQEGEPISFEGEVCCGKGNSAITLPDFSRAECENQGIIVGDIGNGAIFQQDYICESNGQPPIAYIVPQEGRAISFEGQVCCGYDDSNTTRPDFSRGECEDQGIVVGDIGNGAIFQDDYICESNGQPPIGNILPQEGEAFSFEGEVCCGNHAIETMVLRPEFSRQECLSNNGMIVPDIGDGSTRQSEYICQESGNKPIANIVPLPGEPIAREGEVCCETVGEGNSEPGTTTVESLPLEESVRSEQSRQDCLDQGGTIIGDIGNGFIFRHDYLCESNGEPPLANIVPQPGEPIATEGEVCCGPTASVAQLHPGDSSTREEMSREQCEDVGIVIGEVGNGTTRKEGYLCESNGEPPLANVVASLGEPITSEFEVCCGLSSADTSVGVMASSAEVYYLNNIPLILLLGTFFL